MDHHHHQHHLNESLLTAAPLDFAGFVLLLSYSLAASLHCAAMCAPLAAAQLGRQANFSDYGIWLYNLGRGLSYTIAGAILGLLGYWLHSLVWLGQAISLLIAAVLAGMGLWLIWQKNALPTFLHASLSQQALGKLARVIRLCPPALQSFALGLVTVLLPCATLTPALLAAAGTADSGSGAWMMLAFFLGTLPVMLIAPILPQRFVGLVPQNWLSRLIGVFLILTAVITAMRGFHHH